jgi:hypothetical protein
MVVEFGLELGSCLVHFLCSNPYISDIDYYRRREVLESLRVYFIYTFVLVVFHSYYYGTSCMQCFCISWHIRNLLLTVLRLNKSHMLVESIVSLHPLHAAHAQHQHLSLTTVYTPLLTWH